MAKVGSSAMRLIQRYQTFLFVAMVLVAVQLYLGYTFYTISQEGQFEDTWKLNKIRADRIKKNKLLFAEPDEGGMMEPEHREPVFNVDQPQTSKQTLHSFVRYSKPPFRLKSVVESGHVNESSARNAFAGVKRAVFQPRCLITEDSEKEAYSALQRATSIQCKQEIADVVCLKKEGKLFVPKELPNYCPLRSQNRGKHIGCFQDNKKSRLLSDMVKSFTSDNSVYHCILTCLRGGYEYAGVEWGIECYCAESFKQQEARKLDSNFCNTPCSGDRMTTCGGYNAISIYTTGAGVRKFSYPALVDPASLPSGQPKTRIVFVLTLNGRSLRQVTRLIKALYHTDHYILIHVDSRQEYLFRELSRVTANYNNIRMVPYRYATIWGGANLTTMLLKCMEFLFTLTTWKWDFFINLSESDYPIRPVEHLIAFLTMNKGLNFLRSHGKDTSRSVRWTGILLAVLMYVMSFIVI